MYNTLFLFTSLLFSHQTNSLNFTLPLSHRNRFCYAWNDKNVRYVFRLHNPIFFRYALFPLKDNTRVHNTILGNFSAAAAGSRRNEIFSITFIFTSSWFFRVEIVLIKAIFLLLFRFHSFWFLADKHLNAFKVCSIFAVRREILLRHTPTSYQLLKVYSDFVY